jgi:hypothetical protein
VVNGSPYVGVSSWPESGMDAADLMAIDTSGNFLDESVFTSLPFLSQWRDGLPDRSINRALTAVPGSPFPAGDSPGPPTAVGLP